MIYNQKLRISQRVLDKMHQSFRLRQKDRKQSLTRVSHFIIGEYIGKGGFATVYKALEIYTKTEVAAKVINLEELSSAQIKQIQNEIQIQSKLDHPNIVRIYEAFWTQTNVYIFMELIKGRQLFEHIAKNGPVKQIFAAKIFHQICSAVKYLHQNGVSHRDIKTENIIIDSQYNAKLVDFGLAKTFKIDQNHLFSTFCGSPSYTPPEMVERKKYRGTQIDVWCLGVTLYVMLEASLPFDHQGEKLRKQNITLLNWEKIMFSSSQALEIYKLIFQKSEYRLTLDELMHTTFFQKYFLKKIIQPKSKITDEEFSKSLNVNSNFISTISNWLQLREQQVKIKLLQKKLGPETCIYQLLLTKKKLSQNVIINRSMELRQQKQVEIGNRPQRRTLVYKKNNKQHQQQKMQSVPKARCSTRNKNSNIKIFPLIKDPSFQAKIETDKIIGRKAETIQTIVKSKLDKQDLATRIKFKAQHLMGKNLEATIQKRTLKEAKSQSPKKTY